jgi:hypothetical protein
MQYIFSNSLLKSLLVKSIRIGWFEGCKFAIENLPKSTSESVFITQLFEDVFPAVEELKQFYYLVKDAVNGNNEALFELLKENTHHGKGFTFLMIDYFKVCKQASYDFEYQYFYDNFQIKIPPRASEWAFIYRKMSPTLKNCKRDVLFKKFEGIPLAIIDKHTIESKEINQYKSFLSGFFDIHLQIAKEVVKNGWKNIRNKTFENYYIKINNGIAYKLETIKVFQPKLF